jgi:hypothetical protein
LNGEGKLTETNGKITILKYNNGTLINETNKIE